MNTFIAPPRPQPRVPTITIRGLGHYFGTNPRFWLNLHIAHDLSKAEKSHSSKRMVPRTAA
jgi:plasmid maintenance system antidote protein VapI